MIILVSNAGSTSLKFKLFDMPAETVLCEGRVERVGSAGGAVYHYKNPGRGIAFKEEKQDIPGYSRGIRRFLDSLRHSETGPLKAAGSGVIGLEDIAAVGFKTVLARGFYGVHLLDEAVLQAMEDYRFVAPVHNGAYLEAIARFREQLPGARMVGVFETAFHATIPAERRIYALPYEWYEKYGVQRMGYHGASHSYVARTITGMAAGMDAAGTDAAGTDAAGRSAARRIISCHLGGSCSICAILDGKSVDNSFGFSLQAGTPHANRAGDLDPYIVLYLLHEGMSMEELLEGLEKKGGMMGISGISGDMRDLEEAARGGHKRAKLALDIFVNAVQRYIGQYYVELGGLDALVFTGGIGENSPLLRRRICESVQSLGIELDDEANDMDVNDMDATGMDAAGMDAAGRGDRLISSAASKAAVWVIPANEELGVARESFKLLHRS
ncbi:MAG: acetate/propionate family kinase [Treponema sp.]|jgi:acetate kinase|nr:acetate/propionate family kinase [Treponema sp.]